MPMLVNHSYTDYLALCQQYAAMPPIETQTDQDSADALLERIQFLQNVYESPGTS